MDIQKDSSFQNIYYVDGFWDEYKKLFKKNLNSYIDYKEKLLSNLSFLDTVSDIKQALLLKPFEQLKSKETLYCIRHVSKLNPRVVFICQLIEEDNSKVIILLTSFFEKDTAKDYALAIKKAKSIIRQIDEE